MPRRLICATPELCNLAQLVLGQLLVLIYQSIHIRFQSTWCVHARRREAHLNVVLRVRSNNEVDVAPIRQQPPLNVAHRIRQVLSVNFPQTLVPMAVDKVAIQLLAVVDPLRTQYLKSICFVRVILCEIAHRSYCVVVGL